MKTSYGKGPGHGVETELKRYVNSRILQNQTVINDHAGFYEVAKKITVKKLLYYFLQKKKIIMNESGLKTGGRR